MSIVKMDTFRGLSIGTGRITVGVVLCIAAQTNRVDSMISNSGVCTYLIFHCACIDCCCVGGGGWWWQREYLKFHVIFDFVVDY